MNALHDHMTASNCLDRTHPCELRMYAFMYLFHFKVHFSLHYGFSNCLTTSQPPGGRVATYYDLNGLSFPLIFLYDSIVVFVDIDDFKK